ncbi:MAG: LCP family protein [Oscillospiraceae bacterium]|nr:LCP family protein [Oscillospiraceae bacterium]
MERERRSSSGRRKVSAHPAGHHGRRKKPLSSRQKFLRAAVIVLVLGLGLALAYGALFVRPSLPDEAEGSQNEELDWGDGVRPKASGARKSKDFYTVLILGRDTGGGGNTDTMLLASYDVTNQQATVMSIPRDTMVNVSWDVKKINSVYNSCGRGDKGIQGLYQEISQLVGFEPDYQVVVEWEAVGKIVDAIGGVYFDVPYTMDYHDPLQNLVIEQEKGYRLLSGEDAMEVIRWRKNDHDSPYGYHNGIGDSGRMEVQQSFLKAVIQQMMQPANVLNIGKIAKVFQENVSTDLSFQNILWFGKQAFSGGLSIDDVTFLTMPWKGAEAWSRYYHRYLEYVVPVPDKLLEIVNNQLSPFQETFTLSDLDIMSVNADGSLRSTTGHLEDSRAAQAPTSSALSGGTQSKEPSPSTPGATAPETPEPDTEPPEDTVPEPSTPDAPVQPPAQEEPPVETPEPEAPPPSTAEEPASTVPPADT